MTLSERNVRNQHKLVFENQRLLKEQGGKDKVHILADESLAKLSVAEEKLKENEGEKRKMQENLSQVIENLNTERGISASLKAELDELKKSLSDREVELMKVTETLEWVEKDALITYEDCVKR